MNKADIYEMDYSELCDTLKNLTQLVLPSPDTQGYGAYFKYATLFVLILLPSRTIIMNGGKEGEIKIDTLTANKIFFCFVCVTVF